MPTNLLGRAAGCMDNWQPLISMHMHGCIGTIELLLLCAAMAILKFKMHLLLIVTVATPSSALETRRTQLLVLRH